MGCNPCRVFGKKEKGPGNGIPVVQRCVECGEIGIEWVVTAGAGAIPRKVKK